MATPVVRKHRMSSEERKAAIVEAAMRLFAEKGFRGTTTRELAAAVGVTEPVLYQHFSTKRDLYSAIIESMVEDKPAEVDVEIEKACTSNNDKAFFVRMGELVLDMYIKKPQSIRLLLYSSLEGHELSELFYRHKIAAFYKMLTDYIESRIKQGAFRIKDPYLAARAFAGMITHQGMAMSVMGLNDLNGTNREIVESIVEIFLNGIRDSRSMA